MNRFVEQLGILAVVGMVGGGASWIYLRPQPPTSYPVPVIQNSYQPPQLTIPPAAVLPALPLAPPSRPIPLLPTYQPAPIRDVAWFMAHPAERRAKRAACDNNPGMAGHDPECENALHAQSNASIDRFLASMPK